MISDYVKGKKKFDYPSRILQGIDLHRAIDNYTDTHEATARAKEIFRPAYRLYSGAFVDVVYDHFLATDPGEFNEDKLLNFSRHVYDQLEPFASLFPERFANMFPYMKQHNWLYNYRLPSGIAKSMGGVVRRSAYLSESTQAFELFTTHYDLLQECYQYFWASAKPFTRALYQSFSRSEN